MKSIVCVSPDWGIGDGVGMLYHIPGDLKYFKEQTAGHTVIMGRKTLESLPGGKPLPKRRNIVLTRDRRFRRPGVYVCHDLQELQELLAALGEEEPFVIGGGEIYQMLLPFCDSALVTRVKEKPEINEVYKDKPDKDEEDEIETRPKLGVEKIDTEDDDLVVLKVKRDQKYAGGKINSINCNK